MQILPDVWLNEVSWQDTFICFENCLKGQLGPQDETSPIKSANSNQIKHFRSICMSNIKFSDGCMLLNQNNFQLILHNKTNDLNTQKIKMFFFININIGNRMNITDESVQWNGSNRRLHLNGDMTLIRVIIFLAEKLKNSVVTQKFWVHYFNHWLFLEGSHS